ncbi:MAG: PA14 domain-containing protein, partial [Planctomycetota bacterium]
MFAALQLTAALLAALQTSAPEREPGLTLRLFQLPFPPDVLPELAPNQTPNVDRRIDWLDLSGEGFGPLPAPHLTQALGWLVVSEPGEYRLRLASDDGSRLFLDGARLVDNDGRHGMQAVESAPLFLEAGEHALLVEHFDSGGGRGLTLEWLTPGASAFATVPTAALVCEADPTRVTSPGIKSVIDDRRPGLGLPVDGVHPGWRVETLRPDGFEPRVGSLCFLPDGRLAFGTFDPLQRDEERLPDIDAKPPDSVWALDVQTGVLEEIASNVYEPSGLCVVGDELYVAHRSAIERLADRDGDGYFETHEPLAAGWEGWNYHQFTLGLVHRDGVLYTALSTSMAPPKWEGMGTNAGPNGPLRGAVLAIDLASGDVNAIAGGTRTPNGLGLFQERLLYSDNQGAWYPASALHEVRPGRFFGHFNRTNFVPKLGERFPNGGHPSIYSERERAAPVLWLPHGEVVNSPTTPLEIPSGPFRGQLLIGELTAGGVRRAALEEVDGVLQGALMRFTQGLESGVNRMVWGPDGALYVGGIGAGGNWNWNGTRFGLQRLVPTGADVFEIESVRATAEGFRVRFTERVAGRCLLDPERYSVESWTYAPTAEYGGPKVDVREHALTSL